MFAFGWVIAAGIVGSAVGSVASGLAGLAIWAFSGIAVGAAQWTLICRRWHISPVWWISATAFGAFATILVQLYLGTLLSKGARDFLDLITRYGNEVFLDTIVVALVGSVALGASQAAALRDTPIRWPAWVIATTAGVVAAWLGELCLVTSVVKHVPREIGTAMLVGSYWILLSLPQAVVISHAAKRAALTST